jgi:hypothetical protein
MTDKKFISPVPCLSMQGMRPFVAERGLIRRKQPTFLASSIKQIRGYNFSTTDTNFIPDAITSSFNPNKLFLDL